MFSLWENFKNIKTSLWSFSFWQDASLGEGAHLEVKLIIMYPSFKLNCLFHLIFKLLFLYDIFCMALIWSLFCPLHNIQTPDFFLHAIASHPNHFSSLLNWSQITTAVNIPVSILCPFQCLIHPLWALCVFTLHLYCYVIWESFYFSIYFDCCTPWVFKDACSVISFDYNWYDPKDIGDSSSKKMPRRRGLVW
jgi:hypothetical protein